MLCLACHGKVLIASPTGPRPCPECAGVGSLNCCEPATTRDQAAGRDAATVAFPDARRPRPSRYALPRGRAARRVSP